jgi:phenylacetate-CoA ligase
MAEVFPKRLTIVSRQLDQLRALWTALLPANRFYAQKLEASGGPRKIISLHHFTNDVPFTTKADLVADQQSSPPFGTNLSFSLERYTRCHETSGTSGAPLRWLDTPESWQWMLNNWEQILRVANVAPPARLFFAFSFGPFIGFWLAFEAAARMGCLCLPGGGMSTTARLRHILDHQINVLFCTPTYAIHLAQTAAKERIDLSASQVKLIIVAGEPGGSIPATRARIEQLWPGARVFDHHGMTEVGPVTFECPALPGVLHVMEHAYLPEIIEPATGRAIEAGQTGELVLTTLGRTGSPLLRYRTGDMVRSAVDTVCACGRSDLALEGGILARTDDMVVVRGVNVYPSAVEEIIRKCGGVAEYQVHVRNDEALAELSVDVEPEPTAAPETIVQNLERAFQDNLSLRVDVRAVPSLTRFEMKAKRWTIHTR